MDGEAWSAAVTQDVVMLGLRNEIDSWRFVEPFTTLHPLAIVELLVAASAGWVLPKWRHGVFVAAIVAPLSVTAFFWPWYFPLSIVAALNAAHFAVLLAAYSFAFALKRLLHRRRHDD
jgi:hypothetical protein